MRTVIQFSALVVFLVISLNVAPAQDAKPTPTPAETQKGEPVKDKVYSSKQVDIKAKIKPQPNDVPQPGRDCDEFDYRLRTVLKVVLHKSGMVTAVTFIKKSGCSFDKSASEVARRTKFEPARKDGEPVSQYVVLEYEWKK